MTWKNQVPFFICSLLVLLDNIREEIIHLRGGEGIAVTRDLRIFTMLPGRSGKLWQGSRLICVNISLNHSVPKSVVLHSKKAIQIFVEYSDLPKRRWWQILLVAPGQNGKLHKPRIENSKHEQPP